MSHCKKLECLSDYISLESLEIFNLSYCSRLKKFPKIVGNMSRLWRLDLENTAIKDLSVEHLTGLIKLDLRDCKNLSSLSNASCSLSSLQYLNLNGCSKLDKLPENLGNLEGLEELSVCRTAIRGLPPSIVLLKNLYILDLSCCKDLQLLPALPLNIKDIIVDGCTSLETLPIRPEDDFHPSLSLLNCFKLIENQGYGSNIFLTVLRHYFQVSLSLTLSLSSLSSLSVLRS
jgi:Leucine-rich repeat (LRR) protein